MRLSLNEAQAVAKFLGLALAEFAALYLEPGEPPWDIATDESGYCRFHRPDGRCRIHNQKPQVCRAWPYLPGLLADESVFLEAKAACAGLAEELSWAEFKKAAKDVGLRKC